MTIHVCSMRYYILGLPRSAEVLKKINIKASAMTYTAIGEGCNKLCFLICICICFSGRIQFWHLQPRRVRFTKLVTLMDSFSEAVNCLCADVTLLQLVPLTYSSNKEWIFVLFRVRVRNFETLRMICWKLFKKDHCVHICLFYKLRCMKIIKHANCTIYLYYLTKHFDLICMWDVW